MEEDLIKINKLTISSFNKNFMRCFINNDNLKLNLTNVYLPFGGEKYLDKIILNIEFDNQNSHNNIISKLDTIDNKIIEKKYDADISASHILNTRGYLKSFKESKCGYIQRTHLLKNTEIYIEKKNGEKITMDYTNLDKSYCDIEIQLKGIWLSENNYGLYWIVNKIKVLKFA
jgi:hypothetical protein